MLKCCHTYFDLLDKYTQDKAVLFTNDGPWMLKCGKIPNVLAGMDFGLGDDKTIDTYWQYLRAVEPKGPLINAEYYPGWLTHWQEDMQRVPTQPMIKSLEKQIKDKANVNFYMFYGGTNFGFTAGANDGGPGKYNSDVTSYDYDAPMDEAGNPTPKYFEIRKLIGKYFPMPNISVPDPVPAKSYGTVTLTPQVDLLGSSGRKHLATYTENSYAPKSFEDLFQNSGFILYETKIPKTSRDPALLRVVDLKDRGYVYVDRQFVGVLSRENKINSLPISLNSHNDVLQILVENEGRINYGIANDFKGILGGVYYDSLVLVNWTMTGFPFEKFEQIRGLLDNVKDESSDLMTISDTRTGPVLFSGEFNVDKIADTYLGELNKN